MQRSVCSVEDVRTTDCCDVACWEQRERVIDGGADLQNITGLQNLLNHLCDVGIFGKSFNMPTMN